MELYVTVLICVIIFLYVSLVVVILCLRSQLVVSAHLLFIHCTRNHAIMHVIVYNM